MEGVAATKFKTLHDSSGYVFPHVADTEEGSQSAQALDCCTNKAFPHRNASSGPHMSTGSTALLNNIEFIILHF